MAHADLLRREEAFSKADTPVYIDLPLITHHWWVTKRLLKGLFAFITSSPRARWRPSSKSRVCGLIELSATNIAFHRTVRNCRRLGPLCMPLLRRSRMRFESAELYGLKAALFGEITIKKPRVEQSNYDELSDRSNGRRRSSRPISRSQAAKGGEASANREPRRIANAIFASARARVRSVSLTSASLGGARSRGKPAPVADRRGVGFAGE